MKDIKTFLFESQNNYDLNAEDSPETQIQDYCGGVELPNIPELIKMLHITDFIDKGSKWCIVGEDNFGEDALENADNLDIPVINYSYGPNQESVLTYSELKNMWDNASMQEKKNTIKQLLGK